MGGGAYHASKFALEAVTDALRPEVAPFGVAVVNVAPGPIATNFEATLLKSIPEVDADGPYALFRKNLARRMHRFLRAGGFGVLTADHVATIILKAATASRPRTRYNIGFIAKFGPYTATRMPVMKAKAAQIESISTLEAVDIIDSPNSLVERASNTELRWVQTYGSDPVCSSSHKDSRRIGDPFHKVRIRASRMRRRL